MLRPLSVLFVFATCFIANQTHAMGMSLDLEPKEHKVITNNSMMTIKATCQIHTSTKQRKLRVNCLKNTSQVNGHSLSAGQSTSMLVSDNKTIEVSAEPGAEVSITNLGKDTVAAECST